MNRTVCVSSCSLFLNHVMVLLDGVNAREQQLVHASQAWMSQRDVVDCVTHSDDDEIVYLNVGTTSVHTYRSTLTKYPDSMLHSNFSGNFDDGTGTEEGLCLSDRDADAFQYGVLSWLRNNGSPEWHDPKLQPWEDQTVGALMQLIPQDEAQQDLWLCEAEYFSVDQMVVDLRCAVARLRVIKTTQLEKTTVWRSKPGGKIDNGDGGGSGFSVACKVPDGRVGECSIIVHSFGVYGFRFGYTTFPEEEEEGKLQTSWCSKPLFPRFGDTTSIPIPSIWLNYGKFSCGGAEISVPEATGGCVVGAHIDRTGPVAKVWYSCNGVKLAGSERAWPELPGDQYAYPAYEIQWRACIQLHGAL
eukprot:TRINITY_DN60295_c0_g1_i1.p1 TRINITY_DN60295_c0_g1~~TRINITY_DN60295_c0_g1_i1.p1  ORF type:complete len:358 (+),score=28.27 TRINITY_DN60295_c0_g1_i1:58-1131(+)